MSADDEATKRILPDNGETVRELRPEQRVFGRYLLMSIAGRGGMGVVWRARDEELEREVALKFLPEAVAADPDAIRDLKRETRHCLDLTHPHIVRVYDFVQDGGRAAIAMEFIDGESLAKRKATAPGGCLSVAECAPLAAQLCTALDYAHTDAKVVHRDLKPANVLVTRDGKAKIADFGIARSLTETQTRLTGSVGTTSGTLLYMSPQQLKGRKTTPADDIYALGATLYELLTGKPPFYTGDISHQILQESPTGLAARRAELGFEGEPIPREWEDTILSCLAKEAQNRPADAGTVAERLGLVAKQMPRTPSIAVSRPVPVAPAPPVEITPESSIPAAAPPSRKIGIVRWFAIGVALVLLAGTGYYITVFLPRENRLEQERLAVERAHAEEEAHAAIVLKIGALGDDATAVLRDATASAVQSYLAAAPEHYREEVRNDWAHRLDAWEAGQKIGSLVDQIEGSLTNGPLGDPQNELQDATQQVAANHVSDALRGRLARADAAWTEYKAMLNDCEKGDVAGAVTHQVKIPREFASLTKLAADKILASTEQLKRFDRIAQAVKAGNLGAARRELLEAETARGMTDRLESVRQDLRQAQAQEQTLAEVDRSLEAGDFVRAADLLDSIRARPIWPEKVTTKEQVLHKYQEVMSDLQAADQAVANADFTRAFAALDTAAQSNLLADLVSAKRKAVNEAAEAAKEAAHLRAPQLTEAYLHISVSSLDGMNERNVLKNPGKLIASEKYHHSLTIDGDEVVDWTTDAIDQKIHVSVGKHEVNYYLKKSDKAYMLIPAGSNTFTTTRTIDVAAGQTVDVTF